MVLNSASIKVRHVMKMSENIPLNLATPPPNTFLAKVNQHPQPGYHDEWMDGWMVPILYVHIA